MIADDARKWWALGALALSLFVVGLDLTILSIALPTLATELDATTGQLQWFADAYNLVLAAMLLPVGMAAILTAGDRREDFVELFDAHLAQLEAGFGF